MFDLNLFLKYVPRDRQCVLEYCDRSFGDRSLKILKEPICKISALTNENENVLFIIFLPR